MTEVAHPKLFTQRHSERTNLHPEYICDVLFSPAMDEPLMTKEKRIYEKVSALGGPLVATDSHPSRREQGLHRSPGVVGHSESVTNIWEQEDAEEQERSNGNNEKTYAGDSIRNKDPESSVGSDLDRFVENEFQFLESDDDEVEGRRLASEVPLLGTLTNQPAEMKDQSLAPPAPQPPLANFVIPESDEVALQNPETLRVSSRSSLPQESSDVDEVALPDLEAPLIPAPPPLPPAGVLFAMSTKSAAELTDIDDEPKTSSGPETMHVPKFATQKNRPKNEPQSPQNELFSELQGILNRRLKKINEDIEGSREADSLAAAVAAVAAAASTKPTPEPLNHQRTLSEDRFAQRTVTEENSHPSSFRRETIRTEETEVTEKFSSANPYTSGADTEEDTSDSLVLAIPEGSSADPIQDSSSVERPAQDSFGNVLPTAALEDAETLIRGESRSSNRELDCHSTMDVSSHAIHEPSQVQVLESQSLATARANQPEADEKLQVPGDKTVPTLIADIVQENEPMQPPETDAVHQHPTISAAVPDAVASSKPQSANSHHFFSSHNLLETNPVANKAKQLTRSQSNVGVHAWAKPGKDDWTPQMDLMDNELDDDFPEEITSRRVPLKRRDAAGQQRLQKKTPSKLYQKKPLRDQQKLANPGAHSISRINRAVKKVFGSISNKKSKHRTPISNGVYPQEDGWEIYPARPYDQLTPGEEFKVVGVETRPAYAYNAITRQLVILPDHDRILVTDDGRRVRDQDQRPSANGGPSSPRTQSSSSNTGNGKVEKSRFSSKSKASRQHPPNLNTKTVKSIHMHGQPESFEEDGEDSQTTTASDAYWRRNSSPNSFRGQVDSVPSANSAKGGKPSILSQVLSFRKSAGKTTPNGKKSTDVRMSASDMDLVKHGASRR